MLLKIDPIFSILLIFISIWISFFRISGIEESLIYKECLLFFEIRRRINSEVPVYVGNSFKYSEIGEDLSNEDLADMLRTKTYLLDNNYLSAPPYGLDPD